MAKKALVLSGGGMFGAWQAGAWRVLAQHFRPNLIVGASVGSLNGYAIAAGDPPERLCDSWLRPHSIHSPSLDRTIAELLRYPLKLDFAIVLTDLARMKPVTFRGSQIRAPHLAASCAVPPLRLPVKIDGRWYADGGLLNPLPVFAAVELGATDIVAIHVLPRLPGVVLPVLAKPFLAAFGHKPPAPSGVRVATFTAPDRLGSWLEAVRWNENNSRRWLLEGAQAADKNISALDCLKGSVER
jgi:predicted acylesterase/phospholipase RssA